MCDEPLPLGFDAYARFLLYMRMFERARRQLVWDVMEASRPTAVWHPTAAAHIDSDNLPTFRRLTTAALSSQSPESAMATRAGVVSSFLGGVVRPVLQYCVVLLWRVVHYVRLPSQSIRLLLYGNLSFCYSS
jgi:hypothetical protein